MRDQVDVIYESKEALCEHDDLLPRYLRLKKPSSAFDSIYKHKETKSVLALLFEKKEEVRESGLSSKKSHLDCHSVDNINALSEKEMSKDEVNETLDRFLTTVKIIKKQRHKYRNELCMLNCINVLEECIRSLACGGNLAKSCELVAIRNQCVTELVFLDDGYLDNER
ncbi:hypothetical protein ACOME3_005665 [Neoechinorhynchus agilis]